ncbi:hypothetical protein ACFX13_044845 [Malus domestica]
MSRGPAGECPKRGLTTMVVTCGEFQWQKPKYGFIKVNTDAAWCKNTLCVGTSWVCPEFTDHLQAMRGSGTGLCHTVAAAEGCAIRDTVLACIDNGFDKMIIEFDAKLLYLVRREAADFSISLAFHFLSNLSRNLFAVIIRRRRV